ncbi:lysosomal acid glucosylceramidase-like isoform X2 [Leptidea sinapis]|uniref:lysosomal acid glucosylceramidase-like isoform X2 n=1 Tax=Leptidea sinapis TaxID=189913 RepID=UPI00212F2014|nr:lysosomal acid glucosylceramidase-like isoform X2 [Leptidea sinapis]
MIKFLPVFILTTYYSYANIQDKPCASKQIPGESVVCVCNATYCDELQRSIPSKDTFYVYTSSEGGLRFRKQAGIFATRSDDLRKFHLVLDPKKTYQKIQGFGGSVTDAAGINWKSLTPTLRKSLIDSYYGIRGLEYNMARVPIGGSDFSTHPYAYNELPVNDVHLTNFTLAPEDFQFKLPMIHHIMNTSKVPVDIVATTWSPPPWMKNNNEFTGFSRLRTEYYQTYSDYHVKFLQKYKSEGVSIWGITTTNEPIDGVFNLVPFNSLGWTSAEMGEWIVNNLGPTIRNSEFKDLKILTCDDQRYTIPTWFAGLTNEYPEVLQYIDGIGVHFYGDKVSPAHYLDMVTNKYPDKFILATEACEGAYPWETSVILGSWNRAKSYITDIIEDLNHNIVGWIDWNLCLDSEGGPNWAKNFVDSPIIVFADKQEFYKQPMYYALGHISKFIPRQSYRIAVETSEGSDNSVAFVTPRNTTVIVLYNDDDEKTIHIKCGEKALQLKLEKRSIVTVELCNADT